MKFPGHIQGIPIVGIPEHGPPAGVPRPRLNEERESGPGRADSAPDPQQNGPRQRHELVLEEGRQELLPDSQLVVLGELRGPGQGLRQEQRHQRRRRHGQMKL